MKSRDFLKVGIGSAILFMIPKFTFGDSPETIFEKRFAMGEKITLESHTFNRGLVLTGNGQVTRCHFKFNSLGGRRAAVDFSGFGSRKRYPDATFSYNTVIWR